MRFDHSPKLACSEELLKVRYEPPRYELQYDVVRN